MVGFEVGYVQVYWYVFVVSVVMWMIGEYVVVVEIGMDEFVVGFVVDQMCWCGDL